MKAKCTDVMLTPFWQCRRIFDNAEVWCRHHLSSFPLVGYWLDYGICDTIRTFSALCETARLLGLFCNFNERLAQMLKGSELERWLWLDCLL